MDLSRLQTQLFKINVSSPDTCPGNGGKYQRDEILQIKTNFLLLSPSCGDLHFIRAEPSAELLAPSTGSTGFHDTALPKVAVFSAKNIEFLSVKRCVSVPKVLYPRYKISPSPVIAWASPIRNRKCRALVQVREENPKCPDWDMTAQSNSCSRYLVVEAGSYYCRLVI